MQTRVEQIEHQIKDDHLELCYIVYEVLGKTIDDKPKFIDKLVKQLASYNKLMDGYEFVAGDTLTFVDFMFWEALDMGSFCFVTVSDYFCTWLFL